MLGPIYGSNMFENYLYYYIDEIDILENYSYKIGIPETILLYTNYYMGQIDIFENYLYLIEILETI